MFSRRTEALVSFKFVFISPVASFTCSTIFVTLATGKIKDMWGRFQVFHDRTIQRLFQTNSTAALKSSVINAHTFELRSSFFVVYEHFTHSFTHTCWGRERKERNGSEKGKFFVMFSTSVLLSKTMVAWCHHRVFNCSYSFAFICLLPRTVVVLCVSLWLLIAHIGSLLVVITSRPNV